MQGYVEACREQQRAQGLAALLDRIVAHPALHARFVNTLARLEYVGVRKMLKSRRADRLDLDGLEHMLDEAAHALRLKRAALALAAGAPGVATFADADTLAGHEGEAYFQALDRAAEAALADVPEPARAEANYVLTSGAIEVRAQAFYPVYDACLRARGAPFSVAAIQRDEDRHLAEMGAHLERLLPGTWQARLETVLEAERGLFDGFVRAVDAASRI